MNQLRLDPLTGRWVAVSTERSDRGVIFRPRQPAPDSEEGAPCRFCLTGESGDEPAISVHSSPGSDDVVRVLPNRYPAFEGDGPLVVEHRGPVFIQAPATGHHEVLILSPDHGTSWADLSDPHADLVMEAIAERVRVHSTIEGLRYSQAIVNYGRQAGASVEHAHAQLLGIPFVPRDLVEEQAGFARFSGGCLLCTAATAEERDDHRVLHADEYAVTFAPFWSGTPYELLIVPREHQACFHLADPKARSSVGHAIGAALRDLNALLGDIAYNLVFHSAPYHSHGVYHWHLHLFPALTTRAGFELGTGVLINVISPEAVTGDVRGARERSSPIAS